MATTKQYTRAKDLSYLIERVEENDCCAIVGVSNIGKSNLLRQIRQSDVLSHFTSKIQADEIGFVYIDFNLQLQMTGQGFYELVLRTILTKLKMLYADAAIVNEVETAYQQVVAPSDVFQQALNFNRAIIMLCEKWPRRLILLFDEFDEVFADLEARVFLNLRALRDKYPDQLSYFVMVGDPLSRGRQDTGITEFAELFAYHTYFLQPLDKNETKQAVATFAAENDMHFSDEDINFIAYQSGGHPGLLRTVCQIMTRNTVDGVARDTRLILTRMADNPNIRIECVKLWNNLIPEKQEALLDFLQSNRIDPVLHQALVKKGILSLTPNGHLSIFGKLFEDFLRRQQLVQNEPQLGILIDIDAGQVYVDGKQTEQLTNLEYRLLLLLYGHIDKICDKYRIVEAVWGEDYIEEVDDARIEKLVSRLRQKIEPDSSNPKYLVTIRGRGYRLQSHLLIS